MNAKSERGAILIMVAISLLALTLFSAFVIDQGIMYVGKRQAQNAADAAALAGAYSLTFDNTTAADVKARARAVGLSNAVMGEQPDIQLSDIQLVNCPPTGTLPTTDTCIKADAFRTVARNNPLPTFFAKLAGIDEQSVRATATARAVSGTSANCLKPWAVGDKWLDTTPPGWNQTSVYEPGKGDSYDPPTPSNGYTGTGFSARKANGDPDYYGYQMVLKVANPGQGQNQIPIDSAGWAMELCLENTTAPGGVCGTPVYDENITGCTTQEVNISAWDAPPCVVGSPDPSIGCIGVKTGGTGANTHTAVVDFIDSHDPDATWTNGSGPTGWQTGFITPGAGKAPDARIVPVAVFDVPEYLDQAANGSNGVVRIVKIVGFFLEGTCQEAKQGAFTLEKYGGIDPCPGGGSDKAAVVGRLVNYEATGPIGPAVGGFGNILTLVR